jgi:hypothetical protein
VKKINTGAFSKWPLLEEIAFGNSEIDIGTAAFNGCTLMYDENDCIITNGVLQDCKQSGDIIIPGNAKIIPNVFAKKSSLKVKNINSVTFENGVEELGADVFSNCSSLKTVVISDTVKYIGNAGFRDCVSLESVAVGDGIEEIHYLAFDGCKNLREIRLGKALKLIDHAAFSGCASLTDIYYNGTIRGWYSVMNAERRWIFHRKNYTVHCIDGDISQEM